MKLETFEDNSVSVETKETNVARDGRDRLRSSTRVLVTGGGGFLGYAVVGMLVERGCRVASFSRKRYAELEKIGVEQFQGDLADRAAVFEAVRGCEAVFHTAAKPGVWGTYEEFHRPNVLGTENVIAACLKYDVGRLIHTSSPSVVFDGSDMAGVDESVPYPETYRAHYPKTKATAEREVRKHAARIGAICLRPHLIWGPRDNHLVPRILARGKAGSLARVGDGENMVDVTYIDNAAEAHVLAEQKLNRNPGLSGNVYFISQGEPVRLWDMVNSILKAGGLPPVKRSVSPRAAYLAGALLERLFKTLRVSTEPPMTRFVAEELSKSHWFNIDAAKTDLGYETKISTKQGLEILEEYLRRSWDKKG